MLPYMKMSSPWTAVLLRLKVMAGVATGVAQPVLALEVSAVAVMGDPGSVPVMGWTWSVLDR